MRALVKVRMRRMKHRMPSTGTRWAAALFLLFAGSGFALLLLRPTAAQDQAAESRWIEATSANLARFLPDAASAGLTPEEHIFKGAANDSPHKYICVLAHQYWTFNDPELARQIAENKQQYESQAQEYIDSKKQFDKDHKAEIDANEEQVRALQKQFGDLVKQGKYKEAGELSEKITALQLKNPSVVFAHSLDKRSAENEERRKSLSGRGRNVNFRLGTNRTLVTAIPGFQLQPSGTLAGRPLYRGQRSIRMTPDQVDAEVSLAIFLGPPGYQNPSVKLGESELAVKSRFVWAWIQSRPDTVQADEAIVRKILEKMDYDRLSRLIKP